MRHAVSEQQAKCDFGEKKKRNKKEGEKIGALTGLFSQNVPTILGTYAFPVVVPLLREPKISVVRIPLKILIGVHQETINGALK